MLKEPGGQCAGYNPDGGGSLEKPFRYPIVFAKELTYIPRGDRVIVKRLPQPVSKPGETIIPGSQKKPLDEGTVVAVGPAKELADIHTGQHVCFLEFAGAPVEIDGEQYLSLREQEIHGVRKVSNAEANS